MANGNQEVDLSTGKLTFVPYHQPALTAGDYTIEARQHIESAGKISLREPFTSEQLTFSIAGERFALNPEDIQAVFPPAGSREDHSNVLPHVLLKRSTLPWERQAQTGEPVIPWLALLMFDEAEAPSPQVIALGELLNPEAGAAKFPKPILERGQTQDDRVTVIEVTGEILQRVIPTAEELALLAHVRQRQNGQADSTDDELAVIVCNRLPQSGKTSTMHLVSLEGRYANGVFDAQGATAQERVRLISLKSWQFYCPPQQEGLLRQGFANLLTRLNHEPATLRLPGKGEAIAQPLLDSGAVATFHYMRNGQKTVSWYRGSLLAMQNAAAQEFSKPPYHAADELVRYYAASGMFEITYAAAWELGRMLALQSKHFAYRLYQHKCAHDQHAHRTQQRPLHAHLPHNHRLKAEERAPQLPKTITTWLEDLSLLRGVPFNYLVPDERMLPAEAIRFFHIDPVWINCLLDGAFSIGRVIRRDRQMDEKTLVQPIHNSDRVRTGLLLRSEVVAGWPGLHIDGYGEVINNSDFVPNTKKLDLLRMDRLSKNVLLCIFEGTINTVDVHQKPEMLHFGVDEPEGEKKDFFKALKNLAGRQGGREVQSLPWRNQDRHHRILDVAELAKAIGTQLHMDHPPNAGEFALEMIEGVEKVRFAASV